MATSGVEEIRTGRNKLDRSPKTAIRLNGRSRQHPLGGCRCEFLPILTMNDEGSGAAPVELIDPQFNLGKVFIVSIDRGQLEGNCIADRWKLPEPGHEKSG